MRNTRFARRCLAGLAGLLILTACADAGTDDPSSTETSAPVGHDAQARSQLRAALTHLIEQNSASVAVDLSMPGTVVHDEGRYRLEPPATDIVRDIVSDDGTITTRFRTAGGDSWLRLDETHEPDADPVVQAWPCWAHVADLRGFGEQAGISAGLRPGQPPAALTAASYAIGREFSRAGDPGSIVGTIDLAGAMPLLSGSALDRLGIDQHSHEKVVADFDVTGGVLHGYTIALQAVFQAAEDAGADLPFDPDAQSISGSIDVAFTGIGAPVDVEAPPSAEVMEMSTDESTVTSRMAACGAGSG